jgi:hypothetical protein
MEEYINKKHIVAEITKYKDIAERNIKKFGKNVHCYGAWLQQKATADNLLEAIENMESEVLK